MVNFKFNWDPMLELHIPRIDQQHKKFFEIGRDIEQLLLIKCAGVTDKQLLNILYDLRDFITYHFYDEEAIMEQVQYPDIEHHKAEHRKFIKYINGIDYTKLCEQPFQELAIIEDHMVDLVFNHLVNEDQKIVKYYFDAIRDTQK